MQRKVRIDQLSLRKSQFTNEAISMSQKFPKVRYWSSLIFLINPFILYIKKPKPLKIYPKYWWIKNRTLWLKLISFKLISVWFDDFYIDQELIILQVQCYEDNTHITPICQFCRHCWCRLFWKTHQSSFGQAFCWRIYESSTHLLPNLWAIAFRGHCYDQYHA